MAAEWSALSFAHCSSAPTLWLQLRELLLQLFLTPWLLIPLVGLVGLALTQPLHLGGSARAVAVVLPMALVGSIYSPAATNALTHWLTARIPQGAPTAAAPLRRPAPVAVLVGRGPRVAAATTPLASRLVHEGGVAAVYVSGDRFATVKTLLHQGVPAALVSGDSCARSTMENATRTAAWLRRHHPGASVVLITDPWQLARAAAVFRRQGLIVRPVVAEPTLTPRQRNAIALRETAATLLYTAQGRM